MKTDLQRKFQRDGDWWGQRSDGTWLRWNQHRGDWEIYPLAPPGESFSDSERSHAHISGEDDSFVSEVARIYGFLFITALTLVVGVVAGVVVWGLLDRLMGLPGQAPQIKHVAIETPGFILTWVLWVGAAALALNRVRDSLQTLAIVVLGFLAAVAISATHWAIEPTWVDLSWWDILKGWGVLLVLGWLWRASSLRKERPL